MNFHRYLHRVCRSLILRVSNQVCGTALLLCNHQDRNMHFPVGNKSPTASLNRLFQLESPPEISKDMKGRSTSRLSQHTWKKATPARQSPDLHNRSPSKASSKHIELELPSLLCKDLVHATRLVILIIAWEFSEIFSFHINNKRLTVNHAHNIHFSHFLHDF